MIMKKMLFLLLGIVLVGCAHTSYMTPEFESVTSTLNTPALIDKYQRDNFSYAQTWEGYGCGGVDISGSSEGCSPGYIFSSKSGNCAAFSVFAVYCLKKAGYDTYVVKVVSESARGGRYGGARAVDYHYIAAYKDRDMWWVIDNGTVRPRGIRGPFNSIEGIPYKIIKIGGKK
jgi:hypothetical protein